jgi:alpha-galactosidase
MQEQINEKSVALYIKAGKLTGRVLAQAMQKFLKKAREPTVRHGKQSVKSLTKQGASLTNIEIKSDNIGSFTKTARKYNVDFALKRDDSETPPKWLVFFKAKDADALTAAFSEYSKSQNLRHEKSKKPPLLEALHKAKELIGQIASPVRQKQHGEREL